MINFFLFLLTNTKTNTKNKTNIKINSKTNTKINTKINTKSKTNIDKILFNKDCKYTCNESYTGYNEFYQNNSSKTNKTSSFTSDSSKTNKTSNLTSYSSKSFDDKININNNLQNNTIKQSALSKLFLPINDNVS